MRRLLVAALLHVSCGGSTAPAKPDPTAPPKAEPTAPDAATPEEMPAVTTPTTPQIHLFELEDAAFFAEGAIESTAQVRKRLIRGGARGVRIDAPFAVDGSAESTVPVLGFVATDAGGDTSFTGWIVGVQQNTAGFEVARPASPKMPASGKSGGKMPSKNRGKAEGKMAAPAATAPKPKGVVSSPFAHDARALLGGLDWSDASVRVYAVQGPHVSNGVTVSVRGGTSGSAREPDVATSEPGTTVGAEPLALAGPATAVTEPGGTVTLSGHVKGPGDATRVYLFAVKDGPAGPFENTIEVPLKDGAGAFTINLLGDNPLPKAPGTWHIYAFAGEHVAGPVTIELTPGAKPW